jgi:hypothetical protein
MATVFRHPEKYPHRTGLHFDCIGCKKCVIASKALTAKKMLNMEKLTVKPVVVADSGEIIPTRTGMIKLGDYTPITIETVSRWKSLPATKSQEIETYSFESKGKEPEEEEELEEVEEEEEIKTEKVLPPWRTESQTTATLPPWAATTNNTTSQQEAVPLAQTWKATRLGPASSYDGNSSIPTLRRSSSSTEKVLRRVIDTASGRKYFIGEQEVSRDVFMAEI